MSRKKEVTVSQPIGTVLPDDTTEEVVTGQQEETAEETATEEANAEPEEEKPEAPAAVVYLGPDIYRVANHGTVYADGVIPEALKAKIEELPAINGLIVPVDLYAEVAKAVKEPTGRYSFLYNIVLKATKEN